MSADRRIEKTVHLALWTAAASILFMAEEAVAVPIPLFKLGIANAVTLAVLVWYGGKAAVSVAILRALVAGLLTGSLFQPSFVFSAAGGVAAALAMAAAHGVGRRIFGLAGLSLLGAFTKNAAQLAVASFFYIRSMNLWALLPLFFAVSLAAGTLVGILAWGLLSRLEPVTPLRD